MKVDTISKLTPVYRESRIRFTRKLAMTRTKARRKTKTNLVGKSDL